MDRGGGIPDVGLRLLRTRVRPRCKSAFRLPKIPYEGQKVIELKYKDHYVGEGYPDLVIRSGDEKMIVELKAVSGDLGASDVSGVDFVTLIQLRHDGTPDIGNDCDASR
jgi:hypothetical protein